MKDLGQINGVDGVKSVSEVVSLLGSREFIDFHRHEVQDYSQETLYRFPFGIWFRGHSDANWELIPAIFRDDFDFDETSMFHHFQLRAPEYRGSYRSILTGFA